MQPSHQPDGRMSSQTTSYPLFRNAQPKPVRALKAIAILTFILAAGTAQSATYTIQIGAFKTPSAQYVQAARSVGEVYATERASGVIALSVGSFASNAEANQALARVQQQYPEAFVRRASSNNRRTFDEGGTPAQWAGSSRTTSTTASRANVVPRAKSDSGDILATLTPSERKHVVYLDGILHFKQGDQFLPLAEYRARNR